MAKLIKTVDGQMWMMGKRGPVCLQKPLEIIEHVAEPEAEPEPEPEPPKKKLKKVYKLHFTKPWQGTYGKWLNTFGNKAYPHAKTPTDINGGFGDIGNMYFMYGGEHSASYFLLTRIYGNHLFVAKHHFWAILKPGAAFQQADARNIYRHLSSRLDGFQTDATNYGIPLAELGPHIFGPPEPTLQLMADLTEQAELAAAAKVTVEPPKKKHRGCETTNCKWCVDKAAKIAAKKALLAEKKATYGHTKTKICQVCHNQYHRWQDCCFFNGYTPASEILPFPRDDWKHPFCLECGSIDHTDDECDYEPPPTCEYCSAYGHMQDECPKLNGNVSRGTNGHINTAPWEKRGVTINNAKEWRGGGPRDSSTNYEDMWPIESEQWNPVTANANLVILDVIAHDVRHGGQSAGGRSAAAQQDPDIRMIVDEGKQRLKALLAYIDPRLRAYCDMVVGGELRHHRAVGGRALPADSRPAAWKAWREIRARLGADALLDAVILFEDFTKASYGGPKWGLAAKLLWMRETNKISPFVFCDKVFDMQHNCGSLLNKVRWGGPHGLEYIQSWLGPARKTDPPDWTVVNYFGGADEVRLFSEYWARSNKLSRLTGITPEPVPRPRWKARCITGEKYFPKKKKLPKPIIPTVTYTYNTGTTNTGTVKTVNTTGFISNSPYPHWDGSYDDGWCAVDGKDHSDLFHCEDGECDGCMALFCHSHGTTCQHCGIWLCPAHTYQVCSECVDEYEHEDLKPNMKFLGVH